MEEKLTSVIIPVYNAAEYLPRCLDSILNNTYRNLEVICINDGSKDSSLEVLSGYAACMNIMIRRWMNEDGLAFRNVTVMVDMDNSTPGVSKFYKKIEIDADIPQEKKDELIKRADSCPVCNILKNEKEFYNMD